MQGLVYQEDEEPVHQNSSKALQSVMLLEVNIWGIWVCVAPTKRVLNTKTINNTAYCSIYTAQKESTAVHVSGPYVQIDVLSHTGYNIFPRYGNTRCSDSTSNTGNRPACTETSFLVIRLILLLCLERILLTLMLNPSSSLITPDTADRITTRVML